MEKRFSWKLFVQCSLDNFECDSFEDFVADLHHCIDWVEECDGRTEKDILDNTVYAMFDGWFE